MDRYEYKVQYFDSKGWIYSNVNVWEIEASMNELGRHGWELTDSVTCAESYGRTQFIMLVFKRKIEE
jgi:hypothetical protein